MEFRNSLGAVESGASVTVVSLNLDQPGPVPAGDTLLLDIFAPAGWVYEVNSMWLIAYPPVGATSGTHYMGLEPGENYSITRGQSVFGTRVKWDMSHWLIADVENLPPDHAAAILAVTSMVFSETFSGRIRYYNATDAAQTATIVIRFVMVQRKT